MHTSAYLGYSIPMGPGYFVTLVIFFNYNSNSAYTEFQFSDECAKKSRMSRASTSPEIKAGLVTHLHHVFLIKSWKERYLVLRNDSTLEWYEDDSSGSLEGAINLKFVAPLLAIGERTKTIPGRPKLPGLTEDRLLMAVPNKPTKDSHIEWFLFADEHQVRWPDVSGPALRLYMVRHHRLDRNGFWALRLDPQTTSNFSMASSLYKSWVEAIQFVLRPFQPENQNLPTAPPPPYSPPQMEPGYPNCTGYNLTQPTMHGNYPGIPYRQHVQSVPMNYNMVPYPSGSVIPQKETIIIREEDRSGDNFAAGLLMGEAAALSVGCNWGTESWNNAPPTVIENTEINIFEEPYDNSFDLY